MLDAHISADVLESVIVIKSNSVGYDDTNQKFLKIILPSILTSVTHLFNAILTFSSFCTIWKRAKIVPLPKADQEYRPIFVLPFFIESVLQTSRIRFRVKHSCITALTDVGEVRSRIDNSEIAFLILLDHSKAFDSVHYPTLYHKLRYMFSFSNTSILRRDISIL